MTKYLVLLFIRNHRQNTRKIRRKGRPCNQPYTSNPPSWRCHVQTAGRLSIVCVRASCWNHDLCLTDRGVYLEEALVEECPLNIGISVESVCLVADGGPPMYATLSAKGRTTPQPQATAVDGQHNFTRKHAMSVHRVLLRNNSSASCWWRNHTKSCSCSWRSSGNRCEIFELWCGDK